MSDFGLLGRNIDYSFSKSYFSEKFRIEGLPFTYENFDIQNISEIEAVISKNPKLKGLNVTIPYKEKVISYLNGMDSTALEIGAVNTIKILDDQSLKGFNTDYWGFQKALEEFLPLKKNTALILGTGGASKAIAFALKNLGFDLKFVSRTPLADILSYSEMTKEIIENHFLIVNCTPLGTFPKITDAPPIPYHYIEKNHLLFDLIYNPLETEFLKRGKMRGAKTSNGLKMLEYQAEKAWEIWEGDKC